jgi:hypothetical protein
MHAIPHAIHSNTKNMVFFYRYSVDDLRVSGMYLLNVQMAVCLESSDKCESIATVLNNTLITKMPCDLDPGFVMQSKFLRM